MKKRNYFSDIEDRNENSFSVIADFEGNEEQLMDVEVDEILPVLPFGTWFCFRVYLCRYLWEESLP